MRVLSCKRETTALNTSFLSSPPLPSPLVSPFLFSPPFLHHFTQEFWARATQPRPGTQQMHSGGTATSSSHKQALPCVLVLKQVWGSHYNMKQPDHGFCKHHLKVQLQDLTTDKSTNVFIFFHKEETNPWYSWGHKEVPGTSVLSCPYPSPLASG